MRIESRAIWHHDQTAGTTNHADFEEKRPDYLNRNSIDRSDQNAWEGIFAQVLEDPDSSESRKILREFGDLSVDENERFQKVMHELKGRNVERVVDLGCGLGRHTKKLLERGFTVLAGDLSGSALKYMRHNIGIDAYSTYVERGKLVTAQFDMFGEWPEEFTDADAVIGIQSLYHGNGPEVRGLIEFIGHEILVPEGVLGFSASKDKGRSITGQNSKVSQSQDSTRPPGAYLSYPDGTTVPLEGREAGLPHYYISWQEIPELMLEVGGFEGYAAHDWNGLGYYFIYGYNPM